MFVDISVYKSNATKKRSQEDEYQSQWRQFQRPFVQTWWNSTRTLIHRQFKMTKQLHFLIKLRPFQAIVLGVLSTLYYKLGGEYSQQRMNSVCALGFVSTMSIMLINLVQLPLYMLQRLIFYKHKSQRHWHIQCVYFPVGLSLKENGMLLCVPFLVIFGCLLWFSSHLLHPCHIIFSISRECLGRPHCLHLPTFQWLCDLPIQHPFLLKVAYVLESKPMGQSPSVTASSLTATQILAPTTSTNFHSATLFQR